MNSGTAHNFTVTSLESLFEGRFSTATDIQLLWKDGESFETIFDAVRQAEKIICLVFYIFRNDETGTGLSELLKQKSREGVRIYLLYDHFGSFMTPSSFWNDMKDAGINIKASRPFKWTAPGHYAHRDHRKLIIIDSKMAFTGGLNIANEYSGFHLRLRGRGWRDTGVMLGGPLVHEMLKSFAKSWYAWRGEKIDFPDIPQPSEFREDRSLRRKIRAIGQKILKKKQDPTLPDARSTEPPPIGVLAIPLFVNSARGRRKMRRLLYYSINHTQKSIDLTTAYFIPSRRMAETLENAVKRGVRVRLLLPGISDIPAASYAGKAFFSRLLRAGVEIYLYGGRILHAKTYMFDNCWNIIGSTNLDFQSLRYNDEGNVGILDEDFALRMASIFENDLIKSTKVDPEEWSKRPFSEKLKEHFFSLFRRRL